MMRRGASPRNDGLDLIRATGAFLVFATHLYHNFGQTWLGPLAAGGYIGVYIFFPLSGYLLFRPFVRGPVPLGRYAVNRVARLAPAYYLALALLAVTNLEPSLRENPWPALIVATNVFPAQANLSVFGQSWTLGVEVAFYALLPLVARVRWWPILAAASFVLTTWIARDPWLFNQLPAIFWAFGAGMLVARYQDRLPVVHWSLGLALLVLGVMMAAYGRGDAATVVGTSLLILYAVRRQPRIPGVAWPADLSFAVYLWHPAIALLVTRVVAGPAVVLAAVPLTLIVALGSYVLVERPILAWVRRRNDERRSGALHGRPGRPTPAVAPRLHDDLRGDAPAGHRRDAGRPRRADPGPVRAE